MKMIRTFQIVVITACLSLTAFAGRTVHDELGRAVTVPDHARRLVCLAPSITDVVYALGRADDIAAITDYTKYPAEARQKASVGGVVNPSLEKLVDLKPDLVLAIAELNNQNLVQAIEKLGFPVFVIQPHGLQGIYRSIASVGIAIGAEKEATALVARLRAREEAVRRRVSGKPRPGVLFLLWADPAMTAGHGAFITELIEIAGARSITADLPNEWPRLSFEAILARQPEYLVLVRGSDVTLDSLRREGNWKKLQAVKDGKVFYADDRIEYPGTVALDGLEDLAAQFHPVGEQETNHAPPR